MMRRRLVLLMAVLVLALVGALPATAQAPVSVFVDVSNYGCVPQGCPGATEGIAIDNRGNIYFTMFALGEILKASPEGSISRLAEIPGFVSGENALLGLAFGPDGDLYGVVAPYPFDVPPNNAVGVWKVSPDGTEVRQFASGANFMGFPNYPAFDRQGNLFLSDSMKGTIFRITPAGSVTSFVSGEMLRARPDAPLPLGANGIAFDNKGDLYVGLTAGGSSPDPSNPFYPFTGAVVKVVVNPDGTAGPMTTIADQIGSADGMAFDTEGNLYVAQPLANSIAVIAKDGQVSTLASGVPLAMPASLAIAANGKTMYATNLDFVGMIPVPLGPPGVSAIDLRSAGAERAPAPAWPPVGPELSVQQSGNVVTATVWITNQGDKDTDVLTVRSQVPKGARYVDSWAGWGRGFNAGVFDGNDVGWVNRSGVKAGARQGPFVYVFDISGLDPNARLSLSAWVKWAGQVPGTANSNAASVRPLPLAE